MKIRVGEINESSRKLGWGGGEEGKENGNSNNNNRLGRETKGDGKDQTRNEPPIPPLLHIFGFSLDFVW